MGADHGFPRPTFADHIRVQQIKDEQRLWGLGRRVPRAMGSARTSPRKREPGSVPVLSVKYGQLA